MESDDSISDHKQRVPDVQQLETCPDCHGFELFIFYLHT